MINISYNLEEELEKGLGNGPLTLEIVCTECNSYFELGKEGVAMAFITNTSFIEYLRWIQNSPCPKCSVKKNEMD